MTSPIIEHLNESTTTPVTGMAFPGANGVNYTTSNTTSQTAQNTSVPVTNSTVNVSVPTDTPAQSK